MNSPFEHLLICVNNEGEAAGQPVEAFLVANEFYRARNVCQGKLYQNELIGELYDAQGNRVQVNPDIPCWRLQERFACKAVICLN
jgi:hypothetical protein